MNITVQDPALDQERQIAERVMGWHLDGIQGGFCLPSLAMVFITNDGLGGRRHISNGVPLMNAGTQFRPLTSLEDAFEVMKRISSLGKFVLILWQEPRLKRWACAISGRMEVQDIPHGDHWIDSQLDGVEYADTPARAICQAALRAIAKS